MALTAEEIEELRSYINGVMGRAGQHAGQVNEIALALTGAILWRKEDDEPIKVMADREEAKGVLWVRMGGSPYAFTYNHASGNIEMRKETTQSPVLHQFSNSTRLSDLWHIFAAL